MIYPVDFERKIDFVPIREYLRNRCGSALAKEKVEAMAFLTKVSQIRPLLEQTAQMVSLMADGTFTLPELNGTDLRENLARVRIEGLFLDEEELFEVRKVAASAYGWTHFLATLPAERFPALVAKGAQYEGQELAAVMPLVDSVIDKYGRLKDNASPLLARLKGDLNKASAAVSQTLNSILRTAKAEGMVEKDTAPTLREGRLVIPLPPMYKRKLGGIVHDESATGKTVFIEPQQVVEANNRIREIENEINRERVRILVQTTQALRPLEGVLQASLLFLGEIDFLCAKASLARQLKAIAPFLSEGVSLDLREGYNPILLLNALKNKKKVVPLTLRLTPENRVLLISGPNAGGKSVCLKTVALLQYMLQLGLLVPVAESTTMGVFEQLCIDIGDEQSIENDLSTYSSHLRNMRFFLTHADPKTLLLMDEFGTGTEPQMGGALAQAVLEELVKKGAFGVITTHYSNLKTLAQNLPGLINGAMLYDRSAMRPLFELSVGQAGSSFAVEMARNMGLPENCIERAIELVGSGYVDYEKNLSIVARDKRYWASKREKIHEQEKALDTARERYEQLIQQVEQQQKALLNQAKEQAKALLEGANAQIENTIRTIRESQADKEKTKTARTQLAQAAQAIEQAQVTPSAVSLPKNKRKRQKQASPSQATTAPTLPAEEIAVGSWVRQKGNAQLVGEVMEINGKKALVAVGELRSWLGRKDLEVVSKNEVKKSQKQGARAKVQTAALDREKRLSFSDQLDLRGCRAEEALILLQNYMDNAVMMSVGTVRILHGTGTGALREMTRSYLAEFPSRFRFHDAAPDQGGAGITVVEIQ